MNARMATMQVNTDVSTRYARIERPQPHGEPARMQTTDSPRAAKAAAPQVIPSQSEPVLPTGSIFDVAGVVPTLYRDVLISRWQSDTHPAGDDLLAILPPKLPTNAVVQTPPPPARVLETVATVQTPIFASTLQLSA